VFETGAQVKSKVNLKEKKNYGGNTHLINTPNTQIHDCSLSWLGTGISIKVIGVIVN
jgi:hypothetical protein